MCIFRFTSFTVLLLNLACAPVRRQGGSETASQKTPATVLLYRCNKLSDPGCRQLCGTVCGPASTKACDIENGATVCKCVDVGLAHDKQIGQGCIYDGHQFRWINLGVAAESPIGDMLIAGGVQFLAGAAVKLTLLGFQTAVAAFKAEGIAILASASDRFTATNQVKLVSKAVLEQFSKVSNNQVDDIMRNWGDDLILEKMQMNQLVEIQTLKGGEKYISFGTAQELTKRTGHEIAVLFNRITGKNYFVIGQATTVDFSKVTANGAKINWSEWNLIFHSHPNRVVTIDGKVVDSLEQLGRASATDQVFVIENLKQKFSIVIPPSGAKLVWKFGKN